MSAGDVYTVAGQQAGCAGDSGNGGPATAAWLDQPQAVAVDAAGNLYIADAQNYQVQEVSAATGNISTVAGLASGASGNSGDGGPATAAALQWPEGLAVDPAGNVYIADAAASQVREVPATSGTQWGQPMTAGDIYTIAGSTDGTPGTSGDGGPAASALLNSPDGISADTAGNIYISDTGNNRIQEIAAAGHAQWATNCARSPPPPPRCSATSRRPAPSPSPSPAAPRSP